MTEKSRTSRKRTKPLVRNEFTELAKVDKQYQAAQLAFIKRTLAPTLNSDELRLFIYRAQKLGLNPLNGEISAHTRTGKHGRQLVVIIGKDGKARKAMQTGLVEWVTVEAIYTKIETSSQGTDETIQETVQCAPWQGGKLWGAMATVKRKGMEKPFSVTLPLEEYQTGQLYSQLKSTMIKKTALSQAYTMAFPDLFAGVYVDEELPTIIKEPNVPVRIEGGNRPATENQLATIKALDTENTEYFEDGKPRRTFKPTKQEAADIIKKLAQKRGKK